MYDAFLYLAENGYRNVRFHVQSYHSLSTEEETKLRETVSNIVGCSIEEVRVHGYLYSSSIFIVLSMKEIYIERLFSIQQHDKDKLTKLNIDYFKDDFDTVRLDQRSGDNLFLGNVNFLRKNKKVLKFINTKEIPQKDVIRR